MKSTSSMKKFLNLILHSPSRVFVLGSRPGRGKTRLCLSSVNSNPQIQSLVITFEHRPEYYHFGEVGNDELLPTCNLEKFHFDKGEVRIIKRAGVVSIGAVGQSPKEQDVRRIILDYLKNSTTQILWIDFIQLMNSFYPSLWREVNEVCREKNIKVVLLSSMTKELEGRVPTATVPDSFHEVDEFKSDVDEWFLLDRYGFGEEVEIVSLSGIHKGFRISLHFDSDTGLFSSEWEYVGDNESETNLVERSVKELQYQTRGKEGYPKRESLQFATPINKRYDVHQHDLYRTYFHDIPNTIWLPFIDCKKANDMFLKQYQDEIWNFYCSTGIFESGKVEYRFLFYYLFEDTLINFDLREECVRILYRKTDSSIVHELAKEINSLFSIDSEYQRPSRLKRFFSLNKDK